MLKYASIVRIAGVVVASAVLVGAAERSASACSPPYLPCKVDFTPANGKTVPSNAVTGVVVSTAYGGGGNGIRSVELLGSDGAPISATTEQPQEGGPITIKPDAALAPGLYRVIATAEQPSTCGEPALGGAVIEPDADAGPDKKVFRHESTFTVEPSQPAATTAGTITIGERKLVNQDVDDPVFEYPVQVAVAPEMRPYLPIARWTVEVDGAPARHGAIGDEAPAFAVFVRCKSQMPLNSCAQDVEPPGPHKVRVVARLAGTDTVVASNEVDVDLSCDSAPGSSASALSGPSDSASGCNVTQPSVSGVGGSVLLFGLAGVVARLRRRSRRDR